MINIIDKAAKIGEGTKIWHYTQIRENAVIGTKCNIGKSCYIDKNVVIGDNCKIQNSVNIYDGVTIGNNVFIGPSVTFTNDKHPSVSDNWEIRKTMVCDYVSIGANSTIICGITIGRGALIGAGSVVTKDVGEFEMWFGNPAKCEGRAMIE